MRFADPRDPASFAQLIDERTKGRIKIQEFNNAVLGGEKDTIEQTQFGVIDFNRVSTAQFNNVVPETQVYGLPFLFRSVSHMRTVVDGPIGDEILAAFEPKGLVALAYYDSGARSFYTKKPIAKLADMKGMKIRTPPAFAYQAFVEAAGGNAQTIAFAELVMAMKQGVVDGQENPIGTIYDLKLYETQKYMSILNYTYSSMVHVVNKKSWDKLTPEQQKIVAEESAAAAKQARKLLRDNETTQLKDLETNKGIVVARPDLGPWKAAMGPAWEKVKARVGADNFKRFMDMVEKAGK